MSTLEDLGQRITRTLGRPFSVGDLTLPHRVVMAPMTRRHAPGGVPGPEVAAYYARRAEAGVGLIITEGTYIDRPQAADHPDVPRLYGEAASTGWARVVDRVHQAGGRIVPQLWHTGVTGTGGEDSPDVLVESPSGLALDGSAKGTAMTLEDIDEVVASYARAAANAQRLGFDGVELHGAHGYLIDSFLWDRTNRRTDAYGGDPVSRARFAAETVRAVRERVGPGFPVVFRFSQWKAGHYDGRLADSPGELERLLAPLAEAGVDVFHASTRRFWQPEFAGEDLNLAGWTKRLTGRPTITVGSVGLDGAFLGQRESEGQVGVSSDLEALVDRMEREEFDLVAVGRALVANPDWAAKALANRLHETVPYERSLLRTLY
ncbi:NADH:flavin oxidoreductase [Streptomyces sp. NPDC005438]|uniref:NADH:flavin oxidoreductase n=1 Tax=Streptomyces sp. NPDC005438 TaxID=3156880 RepID=UPI0033A55E12